MHGGMNGRLPKQYRLVSLEMLPLPEGYSGVPHEWKIVLRIKEPWWKGGGYRERTFVGYCFEWKETTGREPGVSWNRDWLSPSDKKIDILNAIVSYEVHRFINFESE